MCVLQLLMHGGSVHPLHDLTGSTFLLFAFSFPETDRAFQVFLSLVVSPTRSALPKHAESDPPRSPPVCVVEGPAN